MLTKSHLPTSQESPTAASADLERFPSTGMDNSFLQELLRGGSPAPSWQPGADNSFVQEQLLTGAPTAAAPASDPAALQKALGAHQDHGWWRSLPVEDQAWGMFAAPLSENEGLAPKNAASRIGAQYDPNARGMSTDELFEKVDLTSAESRLAFLNKFTQNSNTDRKLGQAMCGPTALMGGAMLAEGERGLGKLLDAVEGINANANPDPAIANIRKRIAAGEQLSRLDLNIVQERLYRRLNDAEGEDIEGATPEQLADPKFLAVKGTTMSRLLETDADLKKMFQGHRMSMGGVDTGGENGAQMDHWVLRVQGVDGYPQMVYDPYARRDGRQVIGRQAGIMDETYDSEGNKAPIYKKVDSNLKNYELATRTNLYGQPWGK